MNANQRPIEIPRGVALTCARVLERVIPGKGSGGGRGDWIRQRFPQESAAYVAICRALYQGGPLMPFRPSDTERRALNQITVALEDLLDWLARENYLEAVNSLNELRAAADALEVGLQRRGVLDGRTHGARA